MRVRFVDSSPVRGKIIDTSPVRQLDDAVLQRFVQALGAVAVCSTKGMTPIEVRDAMTRALSASRD